MRSKRVDLLIAGVLLVAALASAIGVATYDDDRRSIFVVTWNTSSATLPETAATRSGFGDVTIEMPVDVVNLMRLEFDVAVSGSAARLQAVQVHVELVSPEGDIAFRTDATLPAGGTQRIEVPLTHDVHSLPDDERLQAASLDEARAAAAASGHERGSGPWTFTVRLASAGPAAIQEDFEVRVSGVAVSYVADVHPETPEVRR